MADEELRKVRTKFVEKVSKEVIKQLLDDLLEDSFMNDGEKDSVLEENSSRADQARCLIDLVRKKGDEASRKMIAQLQCRDPALHKTLGLSSGQPAQLAAEPQTVQDWSPTLIPTTEAFWREKQNDKSEIDNAVIKFSKHPKLKETDSVFVIIMSHGKLGAVLGVNHKDEEPDEFPIDNICKYLDTQKCPALLNKPKIIIIQACRGGKDGSVLVSDSAEAAVVCDDVQQPDLSLSAGVEDIEEDALHHAHKEKDFIRFLSCTPDTVSYRNRDHGSFLIKFIFEVLNTFAHKEDIEELFRKMGSEGQLAEHELIAVGAAEWRHKQAEDVDIKPVLRVLQKGWKEPATGETHWQVVVPRALREVVLQAVHGAPGSGHFGVGKMLCCLHQGFYWGQHKRDMEDNCRRCDSCKARKGPTDRSHAPLQQFLVGCLMERVGIDVLSLFPHTEQGNCYILTAMDYFTKWPEAYCLLDQEAETIVDALVEGMFSRFGVPEVIHTGGKNFESRVFAAMCEKLGSHKTCTTPLHPQSNGLVEKFNCTLAQQLAIVTAKHQWDWYRSAAQDSTSCSPALLMLGREIRTPAEMMVDKELFKVRRKFVERVNKYLINQLLDDMLHDGIVNDGEKDSILEENKTTADRARCLIDTVKRKGDEASRKMIDHLKCRDAALYTTLGLSPGQPAEPAAEPQTEQGLSLQQKSSTTLKRTDDKIYPAAKKSIMSRVALLITNIKFTDEKLNRDGADIDEQNMEKLLKALGYEVVKHTNLTGKEIDNAVIKFSKHPKLKETDSVFVVIMSHGKPGAVLGVKYKDEEPDEFPIDNIYKHLDTQKCPALLNKPKIVIIQACRGEKKGSVLVSDSAEAAVVCDNVQQPDLSLSAGEEDIVDDALQCAHKEKDFIALLSCNPDTVSYRNRFLGSFLITYIFEVVNTFAHKDDIEELFRKVMQRFEEDFPSATKNKMPTKDRCSLPKRFYLFPRLQAFQASETSRHHRSSPFHNLNSYLSPTVCLCQHPTQAMRLTAKLPHVMRANFKRYVHPLKIKVPTLLNFADWLEYELEILQSALNIGRSEGKESTELRKDRCRDSNLHRLMTILQGAAPTFTTAKEPTLSTNTSQEKPACTSTGSDRFGTLQVKVGRWNEKRDSLHGEEKLQSFCPTRARISKVEIGELLEVFRALHPTPQAKLGKYQIVFTINPPSAPHFGRVWECEIRSVKTTLNANVKAQIILEEVLNTMLIEVEGILNSKPLGYLSTDVADPEPITPNLLLMGRLDTALPQTVYQESELLSKELAKVRTTFVMRANEVLIKQLLDDLLVHCVMYDEEIDFILKNNITRADKARCLIDIVRKKGDEASRTMIALLQHRDPALYTTLGLSPGQPAEPDTVSYRNRFLGSFLITYIFEVLNTFAHKDDIEELFRKVMQRFEEDFSSVDKKQMPTKDRCSLPKCFYLFPGLQAFQASETVMAGKELAKVRTTFVMRANEVLIRQLLDDLLVHCVMYDEEIDFILGNNITRADKARCLIDIVRKKGDEASRTMIALLQHRDPALYTTLGLSPGRPAEPAAEPQTEQEWSPTLIPTTEAFWREKQNDKRIYLAAKNSIMSRVALLITNIKFTDEKLNRDGADIDEQNMEKLLKALRYEVVKHTNLTGKEIDNAVIKFSKHPKLRQTDSVFVIIMSHGKPGAVLGVKYKDEEPDEFPIDNIYKHLDTQKCPALLDKPKIIIIQACRRDTVSYRNRFLGSFLIKFIFEVVNTFAHKEDIEELFRKVMQRFEEDFPSATKKLMPTKDRCSLPKRFYLFPGL
eukprot:superscaffoldBa00000353_g4051